MSESFQSFDAFYKFYLQQHSKTGTKIMHFIGTALGLLGLFCAIITLSIVYFIAGIVIGYFLAWVSHLLIERNKPATFTHPLYSLLADIRMFYELLSRKRPF